MTEQIAGCEVKMPPNYYPLSCAREGSLRITTGCVHEHIETYLSCATHASKARQNELICTECRQADGHRCLVALVSESALDA